MPEVIQSRLSRTALLTLALGVSSWFLLIATALPALYFGVQAIREINRSDGRLRGQRLAITGLVLSVVVTLVTTLGFVALVLLHLQEKNQLAGCSNNLRQLGQAAARYRDHHQGYYPSGTVLNNALAPQQRLSWQAALVPFLSEGGAAGKKWEKLERAIALEDAGDPSANPLLRQNVAPFLCPTFAHNVPPGRLGLTSYVGFAGIGLDAPSLPLKDPNAGFFGYDRRLKLADITAGISTTMMASETEQENGPWAAGGAATVRGLAPDCRHYIGRGQPLGGLHRGVLNVLWADGSARPVHESINPHVFRDQSRLARPKAE
jgi:prepilin-type processing-associated H-X9-DG protein